MQRCVAKRGKMRLISEKIRHSAVSAETNMGCVVSGSVY